jgi:hypothetical protein
MRKWSKIRMQESGVKISGRKTSNSNEESRNGKVTGGDKTA